MNNELNSIGLNKKPTDTTVVVAMSGGVDLSKVAGMMKKEGYKILNWLKILNYIYNRILEVKNWKNYTQIFWIQLMVLKKP